MYKHTAEVLVPTCNDVTLFDDDLIPRSLEFVFLVCHVVKGFLIVLNKEIKIT